MTSTEVADLALEIHQQSRRLRSILDELLLLASVRKEDVKLGPLAMDEIVAESLERLTDIIVHSEAEIRTPPSWPGALGHGPWIEEVWVNYLSNALAYGGKPPVIEVGAEPWTDAMVRFWVRDNGPGIAPDAREHIFLPFTRLSQVNVSGHGLGLSIVLRIITKLGGEVGVESEPGQGSLFFFTLPAAANTPQ
jgi:signal transduction histidine kinase